MHFLNDAPFKPRDSLQGGRCNPYATECQINRDRDETIEHEDIHSLYPAVMMQNYPTGFYFLFNKFLPENYYRQA